MRSNRWTIQSKTLLVEVNESYYSARLGINENMAENFPTITDDINHLPSNSIFSEGQIDLQKLKQILLDVLDKCDSSEQQKDKKSSEYLLVLVLPTYLLYTNRNRQEITKTIFEDLEFAASIIIPTCLSTLLSYGMNNGLVVELYNNLTVSIPVIDGNCMFSRMKISKLGEEYLVKNYKTNEDRDLPKDINKPSKIITNLEEYFGSLFQENNDTFRIDELVYQTIQGMDVESRSVLLENIVLGSSFAKHKETNQTMTRLFEKSAMLTKSENFASFQTSKIETREFPSYLRTSPNEEKEVKNDLIDISLAINSEIPNKEQGIENLESLKKDSPHNNEENPDFHRAVNIIGAAFLGKFCFSENSGNSRAFMTKIEYNSIGPQIVSDSIN